MSVSVRVVDGIYGRPAAGLAVTLSREFDGEFVRRWTGRADESGQVLSMRELSLPHGEYRLEFDLGEYFSTLGYAPKNSSIGVCFTANPGQVYQITLLVSPANCIIFSEAGQ
ncbi:hydroxyisourate hydrolase [Micromonospora sp. NPDC049081]|uniref:hydroxyisourate hydrolase n=1 Tax=Micromonospora sp. NPDC049081 TaxID=3155150 RepID=UPI0033E8BC82